MITAGPLAPARAVAVIEQIARALRAAHKAGLVHRDVKPSNILLDEDDHAYLIDFGIARAAADTGLTGTGATIGTWAYMAPERFTSEQLDPRADIYALTCVLHESLTGTQPYPGNSLERQFAGHVNTPPPRPSAQRAGIPAALDEVIATGMAKDPDRRYASASELAAAARQAITSPPAPPADPRPRPAPPRPQTAAPSAAHRATDTATGAAAHTGDRPATVQANPAAAKIVTLPAAGLSPSAPTQHRTPAGPPPPAPAEPGARRWRRPRVLITATAVLLIAVTVTAITMLATRNRTPPTSAAPTYGPQVTLPFTGLERPGGVAVDTAGTLYVTDYYNNRVLRLAAGATTPTELPFTGLNYPDGVAVDTAGTLYVSGYNRMLRLAAGATTPTELPFTVLYASSGLGVDTAGTLYATDTRNNRVLRLAAGATTPTELPFTGLHGPSGVAIDTAGTLYVTDYYNNRVLRLAAGATTPTELPFTGLNGPSGVAVDTAGTLYVTNTGNRRVLKLPVS